MRVVRVQDAPFDAAAESERLVAGRTDVGALVTFTGYCRDEGGTLAALELEHYPGMAEAEIERIVADAEQRWPLLGITAIHRFGLIRPGEPIVFVAATAVHRAAAFAAADFLMDYLKTDAPFWKREHHTAAPDRDPAASESWVAAKASDDRAAERWQASR